MRLARVLGAVGRVLLTAGVLTLLFVGYQLWGTGIHEARAQSALSDDLDRALREAGVDPATGGSDLGGDGTGTSDGGDSDGAGGADGGDGDTGGEPAVERPAPPDPEDGDAVARLVIPEIGVDKVVVQGVSLSDLKDGPGRFPDNPLPGQEGNAAIAGHRTTYGAPFHDVDDLEAGDEILTTTVQGTFRYVVREQRIVAPDRVEVLEDHGDDRLTLVACHPKYSARERIVIVADLDAEPLADPQEGSGLDGRGPGDGGSSGGTGDGVAGGSDDGDGGDGSGDGGTAYTDLDGGAGLSGERATAWPTVFMGIACALIWLAAWAAARMVRPWVAYLVGAPVFLVALFFFYEEMSRLLPANF